MWPVMVYGGTLFSCLPAWAHVWLDGPAVYVLCRRELDGRVTPLHIDETADVAAGIGSGKPPWNAALALGMTEIHVHTLAGDQPARAALAARLRARHPTPLDPGNQVHRALARLGAAFAPSARPAPTFLDWLEALMVAPAALRGGAASRQRSAPVLVAGTTRRYG